MQINFTKYHGAGNDFVLVDNRDKKFPISKETIAYICHRRFGVGADGLMLLEEAAEYDFKMRYFNSDGREASMCGNGGRCIVAFAKQLGIIDIKTKFIAVDGEHFANIVHNGKVKLKMQNVNKIEKGNNYFFMNTGSPHYVTFIKSHDNFDTYIEGYKIRYNERFKAEGTNVNFVSETDSNNIKVSTYERGVENETYACGTGCVASAISIAIKNKIKNGIINIHTKGGNLNVSLNDNNGIFEDIWLEGPVKRVFDGVMDL